MTMQTQGTNQTPDPARNDPGKNNPNRPDKDNADDGKGSPNVKDLHPDDKKKA